MKRYWIGVASREHVKSGVKEGIAQVCHGKQTALKRMASGDWIIYYSPTKIFGQKEACRTFTAIGIIKDKPPYQYAMSETFIPWRRDVAFVPAQEIEILPLLDKLSFIKNKEKWGFVFRFGLLEIKRDDFLLIATMMGVTVEQNEQ